MPPPSSRPPLPGIGRRLAGMFYEALLLIGVLAVAVVLPHIILAATTGYLLPPPVQRVCIFLVLAGYFLWQWRRGQTLAMRTWRLRIATAGGGVPSLQRLALRYVLAWPSILVFGVGLLWALVDRDRQFLHDRLAGTRIVSA